MMGSRRQLMAARGQSNVRRELIQSMFSAELLDPSPAIWIVSPWITNITVIDNTARRFGFLDPGTVSLVQFISILLDRGTSVSIVCKTDSHNDQFVQCLNDRSIVSHPNLRVARIDDLHAKGIVCHHFALTGSMNITYSGVNINDEFLTYSTDPAVVHETLAQFGAYLGAAD